MLLVVGGHSRNIGKTSVAAGLIAALPEFQWTALKITQFGHGMCSATGEACACQLEPRCSYAISEECAPNHSDSGRFLAAGARRAFWVRTARGSLTCAMPAVRELIAESPNVIVESNSILDFLTPDLYLAVLDFGTPDFKASSLRFLSQASAVVVIDRGNPEPLWRGVAPGLWKSNRRFHAVPPEYVSGDLAEFVRQRLAIAAKR